MKTSNLKNNETKLKYTDPIDTQLIYTDKSSTTIDISDH